MLAAIRIVRFRPSVCHSDSPSLLYADHVDAYGTDFFRMICEKNLEGIVAKHRKSHYDSSAKWIKIKNSAYTQTEGRVELFESLQARELS